MSLSLQHESERRKKPNLIKVNKCLPDYLDGLLKVLLRDD
jgi:hypothetical protein